MNCFIFVVDFLFRSTSSGCGITSLSYLVCVFLNRIWERGGDFLCRRSVTAAMNAERLWLLRLISTIVLWCNIIAAPMISSCQAQLVPAIFSFGDSLADPGNNNYIPSLSKANFPHNGVDFPAGPTGRFTNGRTTVDLLGKRKPELYLLLLLLLLHLTSLLKSSISLEILDFPQSSSRSMGFFNF